MLDQRRTFYQLREIGGLYGPFTDQLPNAAYIDFKNSFIGKDFQEPVNGMECPWGNVQLCVIYDSSKVSSPPKNLDELEKWVKENPESSPSVLTLRGLPF